MGSEESPVRSAHLSFAHLSFLFCSSVCPIYSLCEHSGACCVPHSGPHTTDVGQMGTVAAALGWQWQGYRHTQGQFRECML